MQKRPTYMQKGPTRRAARQDMCAASAHISCQDDGRLVVRLSGVHLCLAVCCLVVHVSWCMPTKCAYASCCVFAHVFPCVCVLCACIFLWVPTRCACTHTSCHCLVVLHRSLVGSCTDILLCRAQISCCVVSCTDLCREMCATQHEIDVVFAHRSVQRNVHNTT